MSEHRYKLQDYKGISTKHTCVSCKGKRCFTNYIDTQDNSIVHPTVGRCERLSKCGYHLAPKAYFAANGIIPSDNWTAEPPPPPKPTSYFDEATVINSLQKKEQNNLLTFLATKFTEHQINTLIQNYLIGTTKTGATIFWQADTDGRIRAGKVIIYNTVNGKRNKSIFPRVNWAHILMKLKDFNMKQCFFGEHLLELFPKHPVAIVESEKTALIASVYLPEYLWLACGGLDFLSEARCSAIKGRSVTLFPDLGSFGKHGDYYLDTEAQQYYFKSNGIWSIIDEPKPDIKITTARSGPPKSAFEKWKDKANLFGFNISDMLETHATATEKEEGLDLADLLLRFDVNDFKGDTTDEVLPDNQNLIKPNIESASLLTNVNVENPAKPNISNRPDNHIDSSKKIIKGIDEEVLRLHAIYTNAEAEGRLDHHPQRSWIGSMWQGITLYRHQPKEQQYYIEQLKQIQL